MGVLAALLGAGALLPTSRPLAAAQPPGSGAADGVVRLSGVVVDAASGDPVAGARIHLLSLAGAAPVDPVDADGAGGFRLPSVDPGTYLLRIVRIGYRTLTDTLRLVGGGDTRVRASLVPEALDLEPMVVTVSSRRPAFLQAFERRRARGMGSFLTREDIEERRPWVTSDLFRMLPGVRVVRRNDTDGPLLTMRGRCLPQLYIDGIRANQSVSLDFSLSPDDIEAVEVYSSATAPVAFRSNGCGTILVWSRTARAPTGEGSFWKRLAVVGGLFLGGFLLGG